MTIILTNWTYPLVAQFLAEHGFEAYKPSSDTYQAFIKYAPDGTPDKIVEVTFTQGVYRPKTLKTMIKQSGLSEADWSAWAQN